VAAVGAGGGAGGLRAAGVAHIPAEVVEALHEAGPGGRCLFP
jgi:hypothetical protein